MLYFTSATVQPARQACPAGFVLLALISFFLNKPLSKENSESTGPIFTKFSPYGRYLSQVADLTPFSRWFKGRCHGNQF